MTQIITDTKKKGKDLAKDIARQMAKEPLEIMKSAGEQIAPSQNTENKEQPSVQPEKPQTSENAELAGKLQVQGQRQIQALEQEMKEIRTSKENTEKQKETESRQNQTQPETTLIEPTTKRKRGLFTGLGNKLQANRQKERVEKPLSQG